MTGPSTSLSARGCKGSHRSYQQPAVRYLRWTTWLISILQVHTQSLKQSSIRCGKLPGIQMTSMLCINVHIFLCNNNDVLFNFDILLLESPCPLVGWLVRQEISAASYTHAAQSRIEYHRCMHHAHMHHDQGAYVYASCIHDQGAYVYA